MNDETTIPATEDTTVTPDATTEYTNKYVDYSLPVPTDSGATTPVPPVEPFPYVIDVTPYTVEQFAQPDTAFTSATSPPIALSNEQLEASPQIPVAAQYVPPAPKQPTPGSAPFLPPANAYAQPAKPSQPLYSPQPVNPSQPLHPFQPGYPPQSSNVSQPFPPYYYGAQQPGYVPVFPPTPAAPQQNYYGGYPPQQMMVPMGMMRPEHPSRTAAIVTELLLNLLLGIYGVGWLIAGETTVGIILLVCSFFWVGLFVFTLAFFGFVCLIPINIVFLLLSVLLLSQRTAARAY